MTLKGQAKFYKSLWFRNKGIFYRGTSNGVGLGFGILGNGIYVTWDEGMAKVFARMGKGKSSVKKYKLPSSLKLLDYESDVRWQIWKSMGIQNPWDKIDDKMFASIVTSKIKKLGYDGVISDDKATGICVFNKNKIKLIK